MHLLLVGASHRTAPLELRERLDFSSRGLDNALRALSDRHAAAEVVVVSTCNRAEVYAACEQPSITGEDLARFFADFHQLPIERLQPHLYSHVDQDAARHLFRVSSGLESLIVGEPQILGQVKEAYSVATDVRTAGPLLNKAFHWAFNVGKRVRAETALAEGAVSVSFAAVNLAKKIFGDLKGRHVLVIGAGEMGKLTALHLKSQGVAAIAITSRTLAHAEQLADEVGGTVVAWDRMAQALRDADIVITSTGSPVPILSKEQVRTAMPASRTRPLFLIDIAVPRDVDPQAADLEQVFLYNIDDLQTIVRENLQKRSAEVGHAEQIIEEEVQKFAAWHRSRGAVPTIVALRQRFEHIRRSELERLDSKLAGLPPDARARVDEVTRLLVEKLLLHPTEQLKTTADAELVTQYAEALTRLFALEPGTEYAGRSREVTSNRSREPR